MIIQIKIYIVHCRKFWNFACPIKGAPGTPGLGPGGGGGGALQGYYSYTTCYCNRTEKKTLKIRWNFIKLNLERLSFQLVMLFKIRCVWYLRFQSNHIIIRVAHYAIGDFRGQSDGRLTRCSQRDCVYAQSIFSTVLNSGAAPSSLVEQVINGSNLDKYNS